MKFFQLTVRRPGLETPVFEIVFEESMLVTLNIGMEGELMLYHIYQRFQCLPPYTISVEPVGVSQP
jgi:hypothetical protein